MAEKKTQAEETYETINGLVEGGMSMADAVRKVAADSGKNEGAVRGNYYNHRRKLDDSSTTSARRGHRRRNQTVSVDDALSGARQLLEQAIGGIDRELADAKAQLDVAQARYDELATSAETRRLDLEKRKAPQGPRIAGDSAYRLQTQQPERQWGY